MDIIIGLLTTAIALVFMYLMIKKYTDTYTSTTHFICPNCGSSFKLSKISFALALKTGIPDERIVTCPFCGYKGRMPLIKD
ncbi:MAG: hypothetical protein RR548_06145 [Carnobacterium sp.]|uniref:hypothetical protein n=1 Tax=unclassified Carnobacterium TaxID=257487 RepID=UPI0019133ECB|nr:hypothetical protein [Carnobacterium sp. CS13]QQP70129.1 hypothetical protein JHE06_11175 [Carnobacterium sp. CS13]